MTGTGAEDHGTSPKLVQICLRVMGYSFFLVGMCVFLFMIIELTVQLFPRKSKSDQIRLDSLAGPGYVTPKELGGVWSEVDRVTCGMGRYVPYVVWKRRPFAGTYVNIDADGRRRTINKACNNALSPASVIHVYGGSTVWGTGVDDRRTIPSFLSQSVNDNSKSCAVVINCGEGGYVSSQDLNSFVNNLRAGQRPDMAVFYWGINDAYVAYQGLSPSSPQFLPLLESRMNNENNGRLGLAMRFLASTKTFSCLQELGHSWSSAPSNPLVSDKLIRDHVDVLLFNLNLIKRIGALEGVETQFVLQPCLIEEDKALTAREKHLLSSVPKELCSVVRRFYAAARMSGHEESLFDLSHVFRGSKHEVYLDWMHITPEGNKTVAQAIGNKLLDRRRDQYRKGN